MKYFHVSTVMVEGLIFCTEIEINTSSVKKSGEDKIGTIFKKRDIYATF